MQTAFNHDAAETPMQRIKRLGLATFLFFLFKGLAWLAVPFAIAAFR